MKTLGQICKEHTVGGWPDKQLIHSYIDYYEVILAPYRETAKNVLEIGLMSGESLRMWTEYFDTPNVYGIDCDIQPIGGMADLTKVIGEGYKVMIGDAGDSRDIERYFKGMLFDVVIEDANHNIEQQLAIYKALKPYLNKGAIYIIEDIQNLPRDREILQNIDPEKNVEILDRRHIKNRYDDVLIVIKDKE